MDSSTRPESKAVFDALVAFRDEPPPSDPTSAGCVVAIIAIIVLVFMPVSVRFGICRSLVGFTSKPYYESHPEIASP